MDCRRLACAGAVGNVWLQQSGLRIGAADGDSTYERRDWLGISGRYVSDGGGAFGGKRQGICHFSGKGGDKGRKSSGNAGMEQSQL